MPGRACELTVQLYAQGALRLARLLGQSSCSNNPHREGRNRSVGSARCAPAVRPLYARWPFRELWATPKAIPGAEQPQGPWLRLSHLHHRVHALTIHIEVPKLVAGTRLQGDSCAPSERPPAFRATPERLRGDSRATPGDSWPPSVGSHQKCTHRLTKSAQLWEQEAVGL